MPEPHADATAGVSPVQASLLAAGVFLIVLLLLFHATTWSMVSIWMRSGTFAHGFIILPISLWLVWDRRDTLRSLSSRPAPWVVLLLIPPGFAWLLAWLVDVLVIQQLALVAMLIVGAWAIMGHRLARALAFPLLFLFFAVPMGEALVPPMMEFTATSTVWMIQQTGIPVYRQGLYFTLPSGNWSVVEACSGVRYIIASVTLGVLYAYLTYRSLWRRSLFVLASIIMPVFANTVRAYIIVMLGHMSGMTVATGVDHLIYGWLFFGIVIFLLFWAGSFFREDQSVQIIDAPDIVQTGESPEPSLSGVISVTLLCLSLAGMWPLLYGVIERRSDLTVVDVPVHFPQSVGNWKAIENPQSAWQPGARASGQVSTHYASEGDSISLIVQYAVDETEEVIGSSQRFVEKDSRWRVLSSSTVSVALQGRGVSVDQAAITGQDGPLLVWSWYRIGGRDTSNDYLAKLFEAGLSLGIGSGRPYRILIATPSKGRQADSARQVLQSFLNEYVQAMASTPGQNLAGMH